MGKVLYTTGNNRKHLGKKLFGGNILDWLLLEVGKSMEARYVTSKANCCTFPLSRDL